MKNIWLSLIIIINLLFTARVEAVCFGNVYEQVTPTTSGTAPSVSLSIPAIVSGQKVVLNADTQSTNPFFYWCASQGTFNVYTGSSNNKQVYYTPPIVSTPTQVEISVQLGDGKSYVAYDTKSVTISPSSISSTNSTSSYSVVGYKLENYLSTTGGNCGPSSSYVPLKVTAYIESDGDTISFTLSKKDGTTFQYDGWAQLKVGSFEPYAPSRSDLNKTVNYIIHDDMLSKLMGRHKLSQYNLPEKVRDSWTGAYPKKFYIRFTDKNSGCAWVGPITVSQETKIVTVSNSTNTNIGTNPTTDDPVTNINFPSSVASIYPSNGVLLESDFTISASVSDDNGVKGCTAILTDKNNNVTRIPMTMGESTYRCVSTSVNPATYGLAYGLLNVKIEVTDSISNKEVPNTSVNFTRLGGCSSRTSSVDTQAPKAFFAQPLKREYRLGNIDNPKSGDSFEYKIDATDDKELQFIDFNIKNRNGTTAYNRTFGVHGYSATTGGYGFTIRRSPEFSYEQSWTLGWYDYSVKVTDAAGLCSEFSDSFEVVEPKPEITFTSPDLSATYYGLQVPITGKAVSAGGVKSIDISLQKEDGTILETKEFSSGYAISPIEDTFYKDFNPAVLGVISGSRLSAFLQMKDALGRVVLTINSPSFKWCRDNPCNQKPTAAFTVSPSDKGVAPFDVTLDASSSTDPDEKATLTYKWSSDHPELALLQGQKLDLKLLQPGDYTFSLKVKDDKGEESDNTASAKITVAANSPPIADFKLSSIEGTAPLTIVISENSSSDDSSIAKYEWKTSDGQQANVVTPSFTFVSAGKHTVTLTVTDDKGLTSVLSKTVTVAEIPKVTFSVIPSVGGNVIVTQGNNPSLTCTPTSDPSACTGTYDKNAMVELEAQSIGDFTFDKWTGDCMPDSLSPTKSSVTLNSGKQCGATFTPKLYPLNVIIEGKEGGQVTGEVFTVDGQTIGWNPQNSQYPIGIKATLNILPNPNYMWSNSCGNEPITIASPGIECTVRFTPKIVVQGNNLVCMTGLSQAKPFSWLLKNKDGTTYRQGSSTTPTIGEPPEIIAAKFSSAMGIIAASDNCIKIGNRTLFVSYPATPDDTTNMCEVTANGCQFNPTIKLVPEAQMLTTIRGFVWNDADESGLQESGESYLFNWTVLLKRPDGSEISTFTDVNGYYEFTGLSTGNYTVFAETRTGAIYTTSETETVKIDSINIPMAVSFGIKIVVPPGTAQLQVIPSDNGIVSGGIGSGMLYCGYGDNVLGPDCIVNFSTTSVPFGVVKAIPKAGYSFVTWSDPSICPNATAELCNPVLSGGKNLSLSASFKANGEPTIDPNVTIGGNVTTTPTISNVRLSSSIFEPGKQVEISWNSTGQTKYVVYLYDDSTNSLVSDAACPSNSFHPTLGSACLLYETSSNSSVKWTVPWVLPAGHYTLKVAIGNGNNWSDAVVATTPQEALTYLEITPPDNGIISGYIGSTTIYCGHDDNNVVGDKCSAPGFSANIMRILTATPKQGFVFSQWSDASICLFVTDTSCLPMTTGSTNAKLTANFTATESPKPMIRLVATKVPSTVKPGESFDITLRFTPDTAQLADGIEVYLEFDPTKLKINSVNNSGVLDFELSNQIGNNFVYFSAASMFNDVPTETFDLVTINVTALENTDNADNTTLHFVTDHSHVSSSGNYIPQDFEDIVINFALEPVLQCKVMLQGRPTPPAPSWKMELKLYVDGKQDTVMTDDLGQCQLPSSLLPLSAGTHSICVKNSHTLQKKLDVNIPLNDDLIDFGELIEGDTNDDNQLNLNDFRLIGMATNNAKKESCQGDAAYNSNADLNSDGCISIADAILFKSNLSNIVGGILLGDTCLTAKRGHRNTRDGDRDSLVSSAKVNLSIPTGISVGETFDVVVQVTGNVSQPIDAMSMYLNFDPASLQVNGLTPDKHLDFVLQSNFDNVLGQVNFAASRWENTPLTKTTQFLAVNFTLLSKNGESSISFSADPLRQMLVLSNNFDVSSTLAKEQQSLKFVPSYTVSGTVKDKSKTTLSGVTMSVATPAGEKTAVTDAAGNWEIGGLPEGEYAVKGTADNFTCLADIALGNEMYRQPVVCKQVSSLQVSAKSKPSRAIYQGENLTYLLTVTNASNKVATGVVLENYKLPEGVKVVSLTPLDGGECNLETVSCLLPDLTPGTTARAELVLSDLAAGQFHHVIHLSAEGIPIADQINTWKQVKPYLSTAVTCTPNPVEMQKQLHCTATAELSSFAPELTATGVKLQLTLPKGTELKQVVAPHGECDTSQPGKLLCPLKDLSIAASDQVSKTTVDVDLQLVDSGLLVLTTEAKLTATNYAEHIASRAIRIAIPEGIEVDLVIAVDTTYSMNRIINGIIKPLEDFIQKQLADPTVIPPLTVLEEFKDDVRLVIPPTRDMKAVLDALRNLKIEGGGTCPEASVDALNLAADYLKKDGVILGATNAPARPDADVEALKKRLTEMEADGAKIFFIYQPECDVTSGIEQGDQGLGDIAVPAFPAQ